MFITAAVTITLLLTGLHALRNAQQRDADRRARERQAQADRELAEMVQRMRERGLV